MRLVNSLIGYLKGKEFSNTAPDQIMSGLVKELPKIKTFIFSTEDYLYEIEDKSSDMKDLYLPFRFCSFELTDTFTSQDKMDECYGGVLLYENDDLSIDEIVITLKQQMNVDHRNLNNSFIPLRVGHSRYDNYQHFKSVAILSTAYLRMLNKSEYFQSETKKQFTSKRNSLCPEFVKRLIVISSKKSSKSLEETVGEKIKWKHQWRVRGHWRKIANDSIGRDREGDYCIVGRTWVSDFIKGEGPLIEKIRLVKNKNEVSLGI